MKKISSASFFSRHFEDSYFSRNMKSRHFASTIRDYKILLGLTFLWGLPYPPSHLYQTRPKGSARFLVFLTAFIGTFKTALGLFTIAYSNLLFGGNSALAMTFTFFILSSTAVSWTTFIKRQRVLQAMQLVLIVTSQVTPRAFRSGWKLYHSIIISLLGCTGFSISVVLMGTQTSQRVNVTSSAFLWYDIPEEYYGAFRTSLTFLARASFISSAVTCSATALLGSTIYFHVGDIILNFGTKLKNRFQYHPLDRNSLSENLSMFQEITGLVRAVDGAFSGNALFVYGSVMSIFFTGLCGFRSYGSSRAGVVIVLLSIVIMALYCFFSLTLTGHRIGKSYKDLRCVLVKCSNLAIKRERTDKAVLCVTVMSNEIRSAELCVTGGNLFTISNSLILSVTGAMITYGVLIV